MKMKHILLVVVVSIATSFGSVWVAGQLMNTKTSMGEQENGKIPANYAAFKTLPNGAPGVIDFAPAAAASTPAVVHIKTKISARIVQQQPQRNPFADMFGDEFGDMFGQQQPRNMRVPEQRASGSGVLITDDGYIITNNHVIENADEINVTLTNKKSFKATLVGTDPSSDLAVLKIEANELPYIVWGNSDQVNLGQWVLAIGYPWSLDVTVTAGIVSAKARSLEINRRKSDSPIESFIQTDAAVNSGNSGGALVDASGRLIGINSAIASQTGSYAGYSYAIPVNLARKIANDLINFGAVQRAYLGINYFAESFSEDSLQKYNIKLGEGIYVSGISEGGAAADAGIKEGDYVVSVNEVQTVSPPEMVEQIARYKPGDKITITLKRDGKLLKKNVTLKNITGNYDVVAKVNKADGMLGKLGAELKDIDAVLAKKYGIDGGVQVTSLGNGILSKTRMQNDFVITGVNGTKVSNQKQLGELLSKAQNNVKLEGIYPGFEGTYAYPLNVNSLR